MTIYMSSRTKHSHVWRLLRQSGVPIISSWIDRSGDDWDDLWFSCLDECVRADKFILYIEPDDGTVRGALVELGARLGAGKRALYVGPPEALSSVLRHPLIHHASSLEEALEGGL
jgi:hypothetical protein